MTQTLDRDGIAARIPHQGAMCLLERLEAWDAQTIHCSTATHRDAANPLRTEGGLLAPCAIEYAAQAMALHGGLIAPPGQPPSAGYIASTRNVRMHRLTLHDAPAPLHL
ncbi:MAG: hydroxymyristoyl-ACP dehydratase, partial [Comamonadaceae bacterium]